MPLVHKLLDALRALADDEPSVSRSVHKTERNNSRHRQAVALVITFRDLFASSGLNFLLEDMEANGTCRKMKSQCLDAHKYKVEMCETLKVALENECPLATSDSVHFATDPKADAEAILSDERIITSSELLKHSNVESPSKLLVPVNPGSVVRGREHLTVLLSPEDENKTVNALRKVLKWSPRKQSLAQFSVPLPKKEEYRAIAVVQNAVNRVKEEQQHKRKFKLTFC